jgi:hypothetical protein
MSTSRDAVLKAALELEEGERILLATELMDSVADGLPGWSIDDPAFLDELERRCSDGSAGVPWKQVKAELDEELGR